MCFWVSPTWVQGPRQLGHLLLLPRGISREFLEMEQPALKLVPTRDTSSAGGSFICCATMLASVGDFKAI